jgi:predicted  nucleic acid-binding Zn-ribbon protein
MVQGMKEYPAAPVEIVLDIPDRQMLERISEQIKAASGFIKRIEEQEELIEDIEERIKNGYDDLSKKIDEKIDRGMALVLTSADRKIDKGLSSIEESAKQGGVSDGRLANLNSQIEDLKKSVASASKESPLAMEKVKMDLSAGVNEISRKMSEMQMRIEVIEDYLMRISNVMRKRA